MSRGPHIKLTAAQITAFRNAWRSGASVREIAAQLGIHERSVYNVAKRLGLTTARVYTGGLKA